MCRACNFKRYLDDIIPELKNHKKYNWAINAIEDIEERVKENEHIEITDKEFIKRAIDTTKQMERNKERGIE